MRAEPYGLVAKAGIWYLVAGVEGTPRVYRISMLQDVEMLEERFMHPSNFDLAAFWQQWCAEYEVNQTMFRATLRVSPELLPFLPLYFGHRLADILARAGSPDPGGWLALVILFETLETARDRLLGFGSAVEVLEPVALRCSLRDFAAQIVDLYQRRDGSH